MNYTIDIIDTIDDSHTLLLRHAEKSSVKLSWEGGDEKAEQNIVGSSLSFAIEVPIDEMGDAVYSDLFTGNENRFKIRFYATDTDTTIWTGFLLPDTYREPYENGTTYLQFAATDGLGRLKGKYMDADFYRSERTVTDILTQCLAKTGLQLDMYLAPAIVNSTVKAYDAIYLYGAHFFADGKQMDCYSILESILSSMLCELYQADDRWYVEGFNKKHKKVVPFEAYAFDGSYIGSVEVTKLIKSFDGLDVPLITAQVPASRAVVTEKRVPIMLPDDIAQEVNEGWSIGQGVPGQIMPTHWYGNGNYLPEAPAPDYSVALPTSDVLEYDYNKYISLKEKLYVSRFQKMVFRGKFSAQVEPVQDGVQVKNGIRIEFLLNGKILYTVEKSFFEKTLEVKFDLFPTENGNLDLRLYRPFFGGTVPEKTHSKYILIEELGLETVTFKEDVVTEKTVNDGFTVPRELDLYLSDDAAGFTPGFRISKLRGISEDYNSLNAKVLYSFSQNGNFYNQMSLFDANLVADNIDTVQFAGSFLENLEVIYNYQDGEQMVVKADSAYPPGTTFVVQRHRVADGPQNRDDWEKWTDTEYPVSRLPYARIAVDVIARIFSNASERVDYLCNNAVKYNDIIEFDYVLPRTYFPTNVTWNVDTGETEISMHRCQYENDTGAVGSGNIPPIVNAGDDVILPANYTEYLHDTAFAFDPDGFIASHKWAVKSGPGVALVNGQGFDVTIKRFPGNVPVTLEFYVTDSDGAIATDYVTFRNQSQYVLDLEQTVDDDIKTLRPYNENHDFQRDRFYRFSTVPDFAENETLTVRGNFFQDIRTRDNSRWDPWRYTNSVKIIKNGIIVMESVFTEIGISTGDFEFNYIKGDQVDFRMELSAKAKPFNRVTAEGAWAITARFEINEILFQLGGGVITGYPRNMALLAQPYP